MARPCFAVGSVHAFNLEAERGILTNGAVGKQRKTLKHHRDTMAAEGGQLAFVHGGDVMIIHDNAAQLRLKQTVYQTDKGRLTRS